MQKDSEKSVKNKSRTTKSSYSYGSRTFLWKGRVNFGPQGRLQILTFLGLFIPGFLFLMYESQFKHGIEEELGTAVWLVVCYTVSFSFLILFFICSVSDPGYLTTPLSRNKRRQMPSVQIKGGQEFCLHYCTSCCIFRPLRAHHCKICDLCVKERDHHCPFLNNCVGISNRRVYVYFLLLSVVQEMIILAETLCQIIKPFAKEGVSFVTGIQRLSVIFAAIQCLYAVILATNLTSLLVFQMKLVFQNSTTDQLRRLIANSNNNNNNQHSDDLELSRLYNEGCFKNVKSILCCYQPQESIYQYFEPLTQAYLAKRCNFFLKKKYLSKNVKNNLEQEHDNIIHLNQSQNIFESNNHQLQPQHLPGDSSSHKSSHLHSGKTLNQQDLHENTFHITKHDNNHMDVPHIALRDIELKEMFNNHLQLNTHFLFQPNLESAPKHSENHNEEGWNGENLFGPMINEHIRPSNRSAASSSPSPHNQSISAVVEKFENPPHIDMNPFDSISLNQDEFQQEVESHPMASEQSPAIRIITQIEHDQSDTDQALTEQEDFDRNPIRKISKLSSKDSHSLNKKNQLNKQSQFKSKEIDIGPAPRLKPIVLSSLRTRDQNAFKHPTSNFYSENKEEQIALNSNQNKKLTQGLYSRSKAKRTLTNFESLNSYSNMFQQTNLNTNDNNDNINDNPTLKYSKRDSNTDHMGLTQINAIDLKEFDISPVDNQTTITDDFNYPSAIQSVTLEKKYNSKRIKKGFHPPITKQQSDLIQQNNNPHELDQKVMSSEFDTNGSSNYKSNLQSHLVVAAISP